MELFTARLRRVGNSLSVLVPKKALDDLGVGEGDEVEVALLPKPSDRRKRFLSAIGSVPGLGPFERERKDRY
jgi:antitoxin component of MazEF toxin-antitoxin module